MSPVFSRGDNEAKKTRTESSIILPTKVSGKDKIDVAKLVSDANQHPWAMHSKAGETNDSSIPTKNKYKVSLFSLKSTKKKTTEDIAMEKSAKLIQAAVRGHLTRTGYHTRQKESLQAKVKREIMEQKIATAIRLEHFTEYRQESRLNGIKCYHFIFAPGNAGIEYWTLTMGYITLLTMCAGMMEWAFAPEALYWWWPYVEMICEVLFMIDVFLQFRVGFFDEFMQAVTTPIDISRHYLRTYFVPDAVGSIPIAIVVFLSTGGTTGPKFVVFIKTLRTLRIARWMTRLRVKITWWSILRLMVYFFIAIHMTACLWYGWVGFYLLQHAHDSWFLQQGVAWTDSFQRKYIFSMYAGLMLMLGENITPGHEIEVLFTGVTLFLGAVIFATLVGNITLLIQEMNDEANQYYQSQHVLMSRLEKLKLPDSLQRRVVEYNKFAWERYRGKDTNALLAGEASELLLSRSLRTEMALLAHAPVLSRCPLFQDCEAGFIAKIAMDLRVELASPGDTIYHFGDTLVRMFFLSFGSVTVFVPEGMENDMPNTNLSFSKSEKVHLDHGPSVKEHGKTLTLYATLEAGSYFGEIAMLYGTKTKSMVRAKTFCEMQYLDRSALKRVLQDFSAEKELLQQHVKDSLKHSISRQKTAVFHRRKS